MFCAHQKYCLIILYQQEFCINNSNSIFFVFFSLVFYLFVLSHLITTSKIEIDKQNEIVDFKNCIFIRFFVSIIEMKS